MELASRCLVLVGLVSAAGVTLLACGSNQDDGGGASGGSSGSSGRTGSAGTSTAGGASGANEGGRAGAANPSGGQAGSAGAGGEGAAAGNGAGACGTIATFEDGKAPSTEIHVAEDGDDDSGDGSASSPFASIERATRDATPGAAIRVRPGTYAGDAFIERLAGTETAPIWVGGAPGEARPIIEGGGEALHFAGARWVVVHDLEIRGQTANGINADDGGVRDDEGASRSLIFRDLFIHDVGSGGNQDCLKLSGINAYFVLDSEFARCGGGSSGSAIDHVGCHDGLIARNDFSELSGGNAVQCKGGSRNIEVRWNRIRNGGERAVNMGGSTGFEFFRPPLSTTEENAEARDIRVLANVIQGGVAALGFVGCVDCLAANNTLVDPENWVLRILQETTSSGENAFLPARDGRFVNNLIYFARSELSTTINVGPDTLAETFVFANNLWYAHDDPDSSSPTDLPSPERAGIYGQDPALGDVAAGDFSIASGSPGSGAGTPLPELTGDMTGACYADPPSIGAFEAR